MDIFSLHMNTTYTHSTLDCSTVHMLCILCIRSLKVYTVYIMEKLIIIRACTCNSPQVFLSTPSQNKASIDATNQCTCVSHISHFT